MRGPVQSKSLVVLMLAVSVFFGPVVSWAKPKDKPVVNAWMKNDVFTQRANFKFATGDLVEVTTSQWFGKSANVTVTMNQLTDSMSPGGARAANDSVSVHMTDFNRAAGPASMFQNLDPNSSIKNVLDPISLADAPGKANLIYLQNKDGVLVIGQIGNMRPARYFTYVIPRAVLDQVPKAQVSWILTDAHKAATAQTPAVELGIMVADGNGKVTTQLLSVPLDQGALITQATSRAPNANDKAFTEIQFQHGDFVIPEELRSSLATSAGFTSEENLVGIDKLRASQQREQNMRSILKSSIFGQDAAVDRLVFNYGETLTNGMARPKVLVLMGPSGVGKTYIGQEFAKALYGSAEQFLEISGNEYSSHSGSLEHSKLLGTPQSVSNAQEGLLVTWLKKNNGKGVFLINEGDKMHRDVWIKLMELLDQGKISGQDGKPIDARHLVILITTNRGATRMFPSSVAKWSQADIDQRLQTLSPDTLKGYYLAREGNDDDKTLPREVINRIDEFIPFGPFSREAAIKVAARRANELKEEYRSEYMINLDVDATAIEQIALSGWTAADDARQIRRQVAATFKSALDAGLAKLGLKNGDTLKLNFDVSDARHPHFVVSANGNNTSINGRIVVTTNPLKNAVVAGQLMALEQKMKAEVIGQDVTIHEVAEAVIGHTMRTGKTRPLVIGLLGVSGNGKTETARALSNARFEGHIGILSMGEVSTTSDYDKIFGSSAQFQGGNVERGFEKLLRENPEGGVIVFDEISNMGGGDPQMRAAMLMKMYNLFEEGKFTSPIDNREYDLSKYIFILTGNQGEHLFANVTSDDMLRTTWEDNREQSKVRGLLSDAKYPQAFINRANWFLMKPLLSNEIHAVTEKLWNREANEFMRENVGLKITTVPGFFDAVSKAYFSADRGGRAIRDIFDARLGSLIFQSLVASGIDTSDLRGTELKVALVDNWVRRPFRTSRTPVRSVGFASEVIRQGQVVNKVLIDATEIANQQVLLTQEAARATAFHEMGHAVTNIPEKTGERFDFVTIRGGRAGDVRYYGYARYSPVEGESANPDHDRTVWKIARYWAGRKAQEMAGYSADAGWAEDLKMIRRIGSAYLTQWGLDRDLIGLPVDKNGDVQVGGPQQALYQQRLNELIQEGEKLAGEMIHQRWALIRSGVAELLVKGEMTGPRLGEIAVKSGASAARRAQISTDQPARHRPIPQTCEMVFLRSS